MEQSCKTGTGVPAWEQQFTYLERKLGRLLTEQERMILWLRFHVGLDLYQTAERMGLTRDEVRRIETKSILAGARRRPVRTKKSGNFTIDPLPKPKNQDIVYPNNNNKEKLRFIYGK